MELYNYLHELYFEQSKYNPTILINDIYYLNNIKINDWENIENKIDYSLIDIREIIKDNQIMDLVKKQNDYMITSYGIINLKEIDFSDNKYYSFIDHNKTGIVLLRKKDKIKYIKNYKNINDLDKDNISLFISKSPDGSSYIICYDNKMKKDSSYKYILFSINTILDKRSPYDSLIIDTSVARPDVDGKKIVYPFSAFYAPNNLLTPHRYSLTKGSLSVWYTYYNKKSPLKPYAPIDDHSDPITATKKDDGVVHKKLDLNDLDQFDKLSDKNVQDINILRKIKKGHYLDWVYVLDDSTKSKIQSVSKKLIENHKSEYKGFKNLIEKEKRLAIDVMFLFMNSQENRRN